MYKITYKQNGKEKEMICKTDDLGDAMIKLRDMGITKYKLEGYGEGIGTVGKKPAKKEVATASSIFGIDL